MEFYKGYLLTKNKISNERRSGRDSFLSLAAVQDSSEFAGVLADGVILIDFDDGEQAETALKIVNDLQIPCRAIKTNRGIHMLFTSRKKIPERTHCKIACGLTADFKAGINNSYEVLKYDGVHREIILDTGVSELPFFFQQIAGFNGDLWKMKDGDGRDNTLFTYEIHCLKSGLSEEQTRSLFRIINEYVFADKLSESDLKRITRPEAFTSILAGDKKPNTRLIADIMIGKDHIIKINDQLHIYQDSGLYTADTEIIENRMLSYVPTLSKYQRKEILAYLALQAPKTAPSDKRYISFKNGVFDLKKGILTPHTSEYIIPNQIPWNYNSAADSSDFGESMENALFDWCCDDGKIVALLEEVVGYSMYRENTFRKFFVIVGNKRNGKSKFLKVLSELIGKDNTSFVSLENIDARFQNALICGKLLNVGDDIENETCITHTAALKKITSGDQLTVERKGQDPFEFVSYATLVFSANSIPFIRDQTGAVKDRMIVIPFNAHFEENAKNNNPDILDDLLTEENMEYLIKIGVDGLQRLLMNKQFTVPECVAAATKQYLLESDPVTAFVNDNKEIIFGRTTADIHHLYEQYCKEKDVPTKNISLTKLTQTIKKILNCKTQSENGKRYFRPLN